MSSPSQLPEVHARALQALSERSRALTSREDRARKALEAVREELARVEAERSALEMAEKIYLRTLGISPPEIANPAPQAIDGQKIRARIGPQRYLMLVALRLSETGLRIDEIADRTRLGTKRVKDQMVTDDLLGVVSGDLDFFKITDIGRDLLNRYEDYKRSRGEPLPSIGSASDDSSPEEEFE